jgi:catechol 2,3-dioxygenase-like lactoylglutathione lyase family enzyme
MSPKIVPELDVANLATSLRFYIGLAGFRVLYDRPEERFAYLDLDGAQLMLEEAAGPGRRFRTAPLEHPYGRGMNLQIEVADADALWLRMRDTAAILVPREERWYRREDSEVGVCQFVAEDPDGYLLRFSSSLGTRPAIP